MRKRRPPFALVLSTLVAIAALTITLAGRGASRQPPAGRSPSLGIGPAHACVTTGAAAESDDRSAIVISATANAPVSVTGQAAGSKGIVSVTRSEVVTARVTADEPIEVKRTIPARARVCADGDSDTAARTTALRAAYAQALSAAHVLAARQAAHSLAELMQREYPTVLADAKSRAAARAHKLALGAEASLAAEARGEARRRAGA